MSAIENDIWSTVLEVKNACKQILENQRYLIEFNVDTNIPYQKTAKEKALQGTGDALRLLNSS